MEVACEEFFWLPAADKADYYSEDTGKPNRLFSSTMYDTGSQRYCQDYLRLAYGSPVGDTKNGWPDKPHNLWEVVEKFAASMRAMGMELLRLLCEGIDVEPVPSPFAIKGVRGGRAWRKHSRFDLINLCSSHCYLIGIWVLLIWGLGVLKREDNKDQGPFYNLSQTFC